jgi:hypothetical protein
VCPNLFAAFSNDLAYLALIFKTELKRIFCGHATLKTIMLIIYVIIHVRKFKSI